MHRIIAIDTGKFATKIAEYDIESKSTSRTSFRTKMGEGDFRDDALEKDTFLAEIDGVVYKIGNGARGDGAEMQTSKQSEIHRICTIAAIAKRCSDSEKDTVDIAIGLPANEWAVVTKREDFKAYIIPDGEVHVKIKTKNTENPIEKVFEVRKRFVYPESIGALFMPDSPKISTSSYVAVLDIGNLNLNATIWQGSELQQDESITDEFGGNILISGLAQELSAKFSRCNERCVAQILGKRPEARYLKLNSGDEAAAEEIKQQSFLFIRNYLLEHAKKIKRCCDQKKWSLDFMDIVAIGGTSLVIADELREVFGNITILNNPNYCNVLGFLRMMCSKIPEVNEVISLDTVATKE